jgi:predicted nucleotidyltransferase component of viral defense system
MLDQESPATRYRRLARDCLDLVSTVATEQTRVALIEMAQIWTRLAESHETRQPVTQQQQQIQQQQQSQPEGDKKD